MGYAKLINDMTFSFSRLHSYEQCPYQFYLKYIEGRDGESNYFASNGKCMHEVFEAILNEEIDIDECTQLYADKYDLICETTRPDTMASTYEKCMDYLSVIEPIDKDKYEILGVELELNFKIGKYKFTGFVDLLVRNKETDEVILVDHKQATHFLKKDGTPLKNQLENFLAYRHQMYLYCKGLLDERGIKVDKIVWNHFKGFEPPTVIPFRQEEYEETLEWALKLIEKIKRDKTFKHKDSYIMCKSLCDFRNDCEYQEE